MAQDILTARNLTVTFDSHTVFANLSFSVPRDAVWAVVGPNGAGKTVLFKSLLGLVPHAGSVVWETDVRIGYVPQKLSIEKDFPLTVREFLQLKEQDQQKISEVLNLVGFKAKAAHLHHDIRVLAARLGNLSGGELQRILMAWALLGNPNVLLLDEPTAGVDLAGEATFYELFARLKKDKDLTILFISHDSQVIEHYADRVLTLGCEPKEHREHHHEH